MTPGQSRIDSQTSKAKLFSFLDRLRAWNRFACWSKNICAGFFTEARQVCHVISMRVRKEDKLHI